MNWFIFLFHVLHKKMYNWTCFYFCRNNIKEHLENYLKLIFLILISYKTDFFYCKFWILLIAKDFLSQISHVIELELMCYKYLYSAYKCAVLQENRKLYHKLGKDVLKDSFCRRAGFSVHISCFCSITSSIILVYVEKLTRRTVASFSFPYSLPFFFSFLFNISTKV